MLALLLGYYFHTATTVWLDHLANIKLRWGFGYSALSAVIAGTRRWFTAAYARDVMLLVIFANWGVWFPVVAVLYSLPSTLQIPLFGLTLSLWVMLLTWMSELRNHTQD